MKLKKQTVMITLSILLLTSAIVPAVLADAALTNERYNATGRYSIVANGVGLESTTSGDIVIDVPGVVVAAYLYWAGYDYMDGGDDSVLLQGVPITANDQFGPDLWYDSFYTYVYVADITTKIASGLNTLTISEVEIANNHGAGIVVVYEDSNLPIAEVTILDGLDNFWYGWPEPRGSDSEVTCIDFSATSDDRNAEMTLLVGGTEHDNRPNAIWTQTGTSDVTPDDIITTPTLPVGSYPLVGSDGRAWDTYIDDVTVPAGDEWLCVQIESIDNPGSGPEWEGRGTSAVLIASGFVVPVESERLDGLSPGFWKHNVRVALGYPGRYSVPHEGEPRVDYDTILALAEEATGETGTDALNAALAALTAKGRGSATIRLDMANAFNDAAGYTPYQD